MAKFCTKCGKMLADGEICNCGQAYGQQQNQYQNVYQGQMGEQNQYRNVYQGQMGGQNQYRNVYQGQMGGQNQYQNVYQGQMAGLYAGQAAMMAKGIWANIIDIVKRPVTTGKRLVQDANIKTAMILIMVHAIMNAVFIMLAENKIAEEIYKEYKANSSDIKITMPYLRAFIVTILITFCISCALAGVMLVCYRLSDIVVSYIQMLVLVSVRSAMLIPAVFISGVIFIISMGYGFAAFEYVSIIGLICMVCTAAAITPDDKKDKLVLLMSVMVLVFLAVKIFIIYKMCPLYLPEDKRDILNSAIDELKDLL